MSTTRDAICDPKSEAAHTPGPWLAAARPSSVSGLPIVATATGRSIASVTFFSVGKGFEQHDRQSEANARLIAAAPDLLDALRNLATEMRHMLKMSPKKDGGLYRQRLTEAEAAISSASEPRL